MKGLLYWHHFIKGDQFRPTWLRGRIGACSLCIPTNYQNPIVNAGRCIRRGRCDTSAPIDDPFEFDIVRLVKGK